MATKIYKGIKYISQIFGTKDREIEIGLPTDVKHVAHIGLDGPCTGAPSWMNEFKATSDFPATSIDLDAMERQPVHGKGKAGAPKDLPNGPKKHRRKKVKSPSSPKAASSPKSSAATRSSRKSKPKQ
ncbi:hypothetical protein NMG60_11022452 [Bertholletia excelsa]